MALADAKAFEARHGAADDRVTALLDDASAFILSEVEGSTLPWVTEEISEDNPAPAIVTSICVAVAFRAWSNPAGLRSESLGEYASTWKGEDEGPLYLTDNEKNVLRRTAGLTTFRAATLATPYSGDESETPGPASNDIL